MNQVANEIAVTIRLAGERDACALAQLINRAYEVEQFFVDGARTTAEEVVALQQHGQFFILDRQAGPAAAVYVKTDGSQAQLHMLSVSPELQGQGLGTRLVAVAEAFGSALGCRSMGLRIVNLREELRPWYQRRGYRETRQVPFVDRALRRPCHFIEMSKPLAA
jgi:GNAT superfamily N-acetyltransferase